MYILCAQSPRPHRLAALGYVATETPGMYCGVCCGVCCNDCLYLEHVSVLLLDELRNEPHNALLQIFAKRKRVKARAFAQLRHIGTLSSGLLTLVEALQTIWMVPKGDTMEEILIELIEEGREEGEAAMQEFIRLSFRPRSIDCTDYGS